MASDVSLVPDFRALFESAPGLYIVMTSSFRIVAASDAYLQATMTNRDDIVGRNLFDVFLDSPDHDYAATSVRNLTTSVKRVLSDKRPNAMAIEKQDIPSDGVAGRAPRGALLASSDFSRPRRA